jgi:hypothetical protein
MPQSFDELVDVLKEYGVLPMWTQMPHIMGFSRAFWISWRYTQAQDVHGSHRYPEYDQAND